jgi:hypothetical protein
MKFTHIACILSLVSTGLTVRGTRQALDYAALPGDVYAPPVDATATTLADFIKSHSELSMLANLISECGGMCLVTLIFTVCAGLEAQCIITQYLHLKILNLVTDLIHRLLSSI